MSSWAGSIDGVDLELDGQNTRQEVLGKIDNIFKNVLDKIANGDRGLVIPCKSRNSKRRGDSSQADATVGCVRFPGAGDREALKFGTLSIPFPRTKSVAKLRLSLAARLFHILYVARKALVSSSIITTRSVEKLSTSRSICHLPRSQH